MANVLRLQVIILVVLVVNLHGQNSNISRLAINCGPVTELPIERKYHTLVYISSNGSDRDGTGTKQNPWQSISYTLSQITDAGKTNRYAVCIAEGSYLVSSLILKPYIDLYGGYNASDWRRNIYSFPTILYGNGQNRIFVGTDNARIDGFIISRGVIRGKGAGILCDGSSPEITNNIFIQNKTLEPIPWEPELRHQIANDGGAICVLNNASPLISNNIFYENMTETGRGAAIALQNHCRGKITNNVFMYNKAGLSDPKRSSDGGAISVFEWSNPIIEQNIFLENYALTKNDGGAIFSLYWSSPVIHKNIFVGNFAEDDGGAIFTGGQNHHDEVPPKFDPIPDEKKFYIRITDNIFMGNNQALEFSMESRGLFANNIVTHNGDQRTVPAGVYFQRSEAHILNNTILDPFLINFKTFDNKPSSEGLKPSVIKDNGIWGSFNIETEVIIINNYTSEGGSDVNKNGISQLMNQWEDLHPDAVYYGKYLRRNIITTKIFIHSAQYKPNELQNRVIKSGKRWSVVKTNNQNTIELWGDLTGHLLFTILPTYQSE